MIHRDCSDSLALSLGEPGPAAVFLFKLGHLSPAELILNPRPSLTWDHLPPTSKEAGKVPAKASYVQSQGLGKRRAQSRRLNSNSGARTGQRTEQGEEPAEGGCRQQGREGGL